MKEIKMIDAHYENGQKYEVGERVTFRTGKTSKDKIALHPLDESGNCALEFHIEEGFIVDDEPYTYYCIVAKVNDEGKMTSVRLVRRVKQMSGGMGEHKDFPETDHPFNLFMPKILPWNDPLNASHRGDGLIFYETYVIHSFNTPDTPLLGATCTWEYTDRDMDAELWLEKLREQKENE